MFVQTDNTAGNTIVAYVRTAAGGLQQVGSYPAGGDGGLLTGSVVDHLSSEGSLAYDARAGLLYSVNAGSNTITVFAGRGDTLVRKQVISSGGQFPVSIAVHGSQVFVLNALGGASVSGFVQSGGAVALLGNTATDAGTVDAAASSDGHYLYVQAGGAGNVDAYRIDPDGSPTETDSVTVPGAVGGEGIVAL